MADPILPPAAEGPPPQPTTTKIPTDDIVRGLLAKLQATLTDVRDDIGGLKTDVGDLRTEVRDKHTSVELRLSNIETRQNTLDSRVPMTSDRAKAIVDDTKSRTDLELEKSIAAVAVKVDDLTKLTTNQNPEIAAIKSVVADIAKNPAVKHLGSAAVGFLIAVLTYLTIRFGGHP